MEKNKIIAYKGFDENLCCKGFQYKIGEEYEETEDIKCCHKGFHACINPFDVLYYYEANGRNRYCVVEQYGTIIKGIEDTQQASSKIKIIAEIGFTGLFKAGVEWIIAKTDPMSIIEETKGKNNDSYVYPANISSSNYYARICSNSEYANIGSSGYYARVGSNGDYAQVDSSGKYAHINSNGRNVQIGSSGKFANISSNGVYANIGSSGGNAQICSNGDSARINSIGTNHVIFSAGDDSIVSAKIGSWITLVEWKYSEEKKRKIIVCVKTEFVDGERIKEDTWYKLVDGEFVEENINN